MTATAVGLKEKEDSLFLYERKLEIVTAGLPREYFNLLLHKIPKEDALILMDYMSSLKTEINPSDNYKRSVIKILTRFIIFCRHRERERESTYSKGHSFTTKHLKQLDREDVIAFLDSFRKPEASDPLHKWIGIHNLYKTHLIRFFKCLYYSDVEPDKRPKPSVIENIPQLRRKEKSICKPTDLWTSEDDLLFLKYCPSKRMKCFHTMAKDTGCRPHELLKLKIKDVNFKITPDKYQLITFFLTFHSIPSTLHMQIQ